MIEVQVPKDVTVYEATLVGPFTARQTICVAIAAAVEYVYYVIVSHISSNLDLNSMIGIGVLLALPILFLAVGKPYGMKPETYLYYYWLPSLVSNKDRPYKTEIIWDTLNKEETDNKNQKSKEKNNKKKKSSAPKVRGKMNTLYA